MPGALERDVRVRPVRCGPWDIAAGERSRRRKATVLSDGRNVDIVCLRAQGAVQGSTLPARARSRGTRLLPGLRLRSRQPLHGARDSEACAGTRAVLRRPVRGDGDVAVLGTPGDAGG